jgi:cAMP-dependent protein kinase regulator
MEKLEKQEYMDNKIKPILENLIFQIICEKPENVAEYMLDWLKRTGGYSNKSLTIDEKKELESLRREISFIKPKKCDMFVIDEIITNTDGELAEEDISGIGKKTLSMKHKSANTSTFSTNVKNNTSTCVQAKQSFKARFIPKNENQIHRIQSKIVYSYIFSNLCEKDIELVIGAMEEKTFERNESVLKQGDHGDCLYLVESGLLECYRLVDSKSKMVKKYTSGDSFGELALLYNTPRQASVIAKTSCTLWLLDKFTFNNLMKETIKRKREEYEAFLKSVEILKQIDCYEITQICDAMKICYFNKGEYIIQDVSII